MTNRVFKALLSVKAKLFFSFGLMSLLLVSLSGVALYSINKAGTVVEETYDRPLMAVNFARSAGQIFASLENLHLRSTALDGKTNADYETSIRLSSETFLEDLTVAKDRSIAPQAEPFFANVLDEFDGWNAARSEGDYQREKHHAEKIVEYLDIIIELQNNESFRSRQSSIDNIARIKKINFWAISSSILLAAILSTWIVVTIIRPLRIASSAAEKISGGILNHEIPKGKDDETGALLKSMAVMQSNIRDRMEHEQSLKNLAQTRLVDSLENSSDAILLTNESGLIIVANPMVHELTTEDGVDLIGRQLSEVFHFDGRPLHGCSPLAPKNNEFALNDGRWFRVNISNTRDGGKLIIWTDITEAKDKTIQLRDALSKAKAADDAKTSFLAAMSHELRTPLNAVIGFSDMLKTQAISRENQNDAKFAGHILSSGEHLLNIVEDVLFLAQSDYAVLSDFNFNRIDLRDIVNEALKSVKPEIERKQVRAIWEAPQNGAYILGDKKRLKQMVSNLLKNAVGFNREDGLIKVLLREAGAFWRIDVVDSGIGMSSADLARVRTIFAQADEGYKREIDGLGIGINLSEKIAKSHNGSMKIASRLDYGTAVSIFLPKAEGHKAIKPLNTLSNAA